MKHENMNGGEEIMKRGLIAVVAAVVGAVAAAFAVRAVRR